MTKIISAKNKLNTNKQHMKEKPVTKNNLSPAQ